jgi:hypothetical protein
MEMQTGSTNKHIFQIFFVLAAPMYWWEMFRCAPTLIMRYKGKFHVSSTNPIIRQANNYFSKVPEEYGSAL